MKIFLTFLLITALNYKPVLENSLSCSPSTRVINYEIAQPQCQLQLNISYIFYVRISVNKHGGLQTEA